jgi:hypothetical protein
VGGIGGGAQGVGGVYVGGEEVLGGGKTGGWEEEFIRMVRLMCSSSYYCVLPLADVLGGGVY